MHRSSMRLMTYFRNKYLVGMKGCSILDVGSQVLLYDDGIQHASFRDLLGDEYEYTGMDIVAGLNVDIVGLENISKIYDVVISGSTMEHVKRPWDWLKNLTKYFSKYICIIAPHRWREHRFPIDTYRYYPDGMRDLFEYAGIKEIEIFNKRTDTIGIGCK